MSTPSLKDSLQLNKPRRTPDHKTKSHVVKVNDGGTERLIRFGQQGVSTAGKPKEGESQKQKNRRKSFKARHAKNIKKGPTSAAYWADKVKWAEGGSVGYDSDRIDAMAEEILNFANGGEVTLGDLVQAQETVETGSDQDTILDTKIRAFGLDPDVERKTTLLPNVSREESYEDVNELDVTAPTIIYDLLKAVALPSAVADGYQPTKREILEAAMEMTGGSVVSSAVAGPAKKAGETVLGMGVAPKVSPIPQSKPSNSLTADNANIYFNKDGLMTAEGRKEAAKRAALLVETEERKPFSKFLAPYEGSVIKTTQADRSATAIGGGPGYSKIGKIIRQMEAIQNRNDLSPEEAIRSMNDPSHPVWGIMNEGAASRISNQNKQSNVIWTTVLGADTQLISNPVVFNKLKRKFKKAIKDGKLSDEKAADMNYNLSLMGFPDGADIRDPNIWKLMDTFDKRKGVGQMMAGMKPDPKIKANPKDDSTKTRPLGGKKGQIFDADAILRESTEPSLLGSYTRRLKSQEPEIPTYSVGPYGFKIDDTPTANRPDYHPGFPQQLFGTVLDDEFIPVPFESAFPQFIDLMQKKYDLSGSSKKFGPGYYGKSIITGYDGNLPTQEITGEYLKGLEKQGFEEGGSVKEKQNSIVDSALNKILGTDDIEVTGGIDIQGSGRTADVYMFDEEVGEYTPQEIPMGFLNGFAKLGILKPLGDTGLSIDGSLSVQGFAENLGELGSQGSFTLGDIEGGVTFTNDDLEVRGGVSYNPNNKKFSGDLKGIIKFNRGGSYDAAKINMMADQILETYNV